MNLTVQIITKNNEQQIQRTLKSLQPLKCQVFINDLGSKDQTVAIAHNFGATVKFHQLQDNYSRLRNLLTQESLNDWNMYLFPGEVITQGHQLLNKLQKSAYYTPIFSGQTLRKEIRIWKKGILFKNPTFEMLDYETEHEIAVPIYAEGFADFQEQLDLVQKWKAVQPTNPDPFYYEACCLLSLGKLDEYEKISEHYMFLEQRKSSKSAVMNRYYYALVQLQKERVRATLQNINLCLCVKPLMAEFWCVLGDVYYHLLNRFDKAKSFYENAIILGSRRKATDKWPMDISKYKAYPTTMIESCDKLRTSVSVYADANKA